MSHRRLALGIVALEFAAAVQGFVSSALLPVIARELGARAHLALLVSGGTVGLFVALPIAGRVVGALGVPRALGVGLAGYLAGTGLAATAPSPWVFALGQLVSGVAGGLLAVLGISALIAELPDAVRVRVVAASSAMWVLPALVGPSGALAVEHLVGWRLALLLPVPIVVGGRLLVASDARPHPSGAGPLGRTLLVPLGAVVVVAAPSWPLAIAGTVVGGIGVAALLPAGTTRLARGAPSALAAMLLFAVGYFGADRLVTVLITDSYGRSLSAASVVLSAAPLCWALTSLATQRWARRPGVAVGGLALAAGGVAVLALTRDYRLALVGWSASGIGVGLAYPGLYVRSTTSPSAPSVDLATAVITAEAFGSLAGPAFGAALASSGGLTAPYLLFAAALVAAAAAASRSTPAVVGARR